MPDMWLPYPRRELIGMGRCADCGFHEPTQGHREHCPRKETA